MKLFDFEKEVQKEKTNIGFRSLKRNLRELKQVGTSNIRRDKARDALRPGKRISETGKVYWEKRKNRSDVGKSRV